MSILFENEKGFYISSEDYFNSIARIKENPLKINPNLFRILSPYSTKNGTKRKKQLQTELEKADLLTYNNLKFEIENIKKKYFELSTLLKNQGLVTPHYGEFVKNAVALETAEQLYTQSGKNVIDSAVGSNFGPATIKTIQNSRYLFPKNCSFFNKDISEIGMHLSKYKFNLVVLDPPWWNKYIRRKRKKCTNAYNMMYNADLKKIPIESLLDNNGIVIVWCTNSPQHLKDLIEDIFPKWGVSFVGKWYWLKVTISGEPICEFSKPPGKQPFEQIIFGYKNPETKPLPTNGKLLISIPSAVHSHKPPLVKVVQPFLPENPRCLEIFARYLLPDWTSYGNEVLRLQHESLYISE